MNANRQKKAQEIENLNQTFENSEVVVVTHYSGLNVAQMTDLRLKLREAGAAFKVTKNTLTRRAIEGTAYEPIVDMFTGPTGIAVSSDPVAAAKVAYNFSKDNDKLVIIGGSLGGKILDAQAVQELAKLPSLDELRSKLIGLLQAPATKIARVLQAPAQQVVGVTQAYGNTQ